MNGHTLTSQVYVTNHTSTPTSTPTSTSPTQTENTNENYFGSEMYFITFDNPDVTHSMKVIANELFTEWVESRVNIRHIIKEAKQIQSGPFSLIMRVALIQLHNYLRDVDDNEELLNFGIEFTEQELDAYGVDDMEELCEERPCMLDYYIKKLRSIIKRLPIFKE